MIGVFFFNFLGFHLEMKEAAISQPSKRNATCRVCTMGNHKKPISDITDITILLSLKYRVKLALWLALACMNKRVLGTTSRHSSSGYLLFHPEAHLSSAVARRNL